LALGAIARLVKLSKQLVSQRLACQCIAPRYRWALRVPGRGDNKTPSVLKNLTMSTPALWYYHKDGRGFGPVEEADTANCSNTRSSRLILLCGVMGSAIGRRLKALSSATSLLIRRCHRRPFRLGRRRDEDLARYLGPSSFWPRYSTVLSSASFRYL